MPFDALQRVSDALLSVPFDCPGAGAFPRSKAVPFDAAAAACPFPSQPKPLTLTFDARKGVPFRSRCARGRAEQEQKSPPSWRAKSTCLLPPEAE